MTGLRKARADAKSAIRMLDTWSERRRQRRQLLALDARMLRDIGISDADAWQEARKPFWRA